MKKIARQKFEFNQLFLRYRKYCKKLNTLVNKGNDYHIQCKKSLIEKRIRILIARLNSLYSSLKLAAAGTALSVGLLITTPSYSQSFVAGSDNPFGLSNLGSYSAPTSFVDIDSDGDLDAFAGAGDGNFKFFENTGSQDAPAFSAVSNNPFGLANVGTFSIPKFIDLDGDGDLDALAGAGDGDLRYFENTGDVNSPAFAAPSLNPFGLSNLGFYVIPEFADLDGDGDLDAFIGIAIGTIKFFENTGTAIAPAFIAGADNPYGLTVGATTSATTFADLDIDGDLDAFIGISDGNIKYFENTGTPSAPAFAVQPDNPFGLADVGTYAIPSFADLDGDSRLDAFIGETGGDIKYFENTQVKQFPWFNSSVDNPFNLANTGSTYSAFSVGDIDSDGDLDIISGATNGNILFYENVGSKSAPDFTGGPSTNPFGLTGLGALYYGIPEFVDIDADGDLDIFEGDVNGDIHFFQNIGTAVAPAFAAPATNSFGITNVGGTASPAFTDIDGDGDLDLFSGDIGGNTQFFENTGSAIAPAFATVSQNPFNLMDVGVYSSPQFVDYDNDGDIDVIISNAIGQLRFSQNYGSANLANFVFPVTNPYNLSAGVLPYPSLADLDGDGDLDLLTGDPGGDVKYYENVRNTTPSLTANTGITLNEGAMLAFGTTELDATDTEQPVSSLVFTVNTAPANGQLELTTAPGVPITSFTQPNLVANQVVYVHDDSNTTSDSFVFTVTDGLQFLTGQIFNITVNPIDDDVPTIAANTGLTVVKGSTNTISTTELSATDTDTSDPTLTFNITAATANGQLELTTNPGMAITSFTQQNLLDNEVVYVHDDGLTTSDSFNFDVTDGTNTLAGQMFNITIQHVPSINANLGLTLNEGATAGITTTLLSATDFDTSDPTLIFNITTAPINGQLELTGAPGVPITTFTQQNLIDNTVIYEHDDGETTSDSFIFEVTDGTNTLTGQLFSITVTPVNDEAPNIVNNTGLTLNEGAIATVTTTILSATDIDSNANVPGLIFNVTTGTINGQLELTSNPGMAITSFTQQNLLDNVVVYAHNGSQTTADSFIFDVTDGTNTLFSQTFNLIISHVPSIVTNTGLTLNEGATASITTTLLSATDFDTSDPTLIYNVTTALGNGQLELSTNPGVAITSFTQQNLIDGVVSYVHNGGETIADSFGFEVTDGTTPLTGQTFNITINPVDDQTPTIVNNTGITGNEGASTTITTTELSATDIDTNDPTLMFNVTTAPGNGQLELSTNPGVAITSFTQQNLIDGVVVYVHNGGETTSDTFGFEVTDGTTPLSGQSFNITVNAIDDPFTITTNTGLTVDEGSTTSISSSELNISDPDTGNGGLIFTITTASINGQLELSTNSGTAITSFTQQNIADNEVVYVHDGGETTSDSFAFDVSDGTNSITGESFNLTVSAVNDAPQVSTNTGLTLDEGTSASISSAELEAMDPDNGNSELTFTISTAPANGQLELTTNPGVAITSFTQKQINDNEVVYVHDGSETTSDSFGFRLTDGTATLSAETFDITISPVTGLEDPILSNLKIYPNPARDYLIIELNDTNRSKLRIEVFNSSGLRVIQPVELNALNHQLDIKLLQTGIYFVRIETDKGFIVKRFIKN